MSIPAKYTSTGAILVVIGGVETTIPADLSNHDYAALIAEGVEIADYAAPTQTLDQIRAAAFLERADFCNALADAGVLTDAEAISTARGDWPASFAGFLTATVSDGEGNEVAMFSAAQQRAIQVTAASCLTFQRNHEFVLMLGWWTGMTDVQVDALFGIET